MLTKLRSFMRDSSVDKLAAAIQTVWFSILQIIALAGIAGGIGFFRVLFWIMLEVTVLITIFAGALIFVDEKDEERNLENKEE